MATTNVEVKLMSEPITGKRFIRVEVTSNIFVMSGKSKSKIDIFPSDVNSEQEFSTKIGAAAGALAEYQCKKYGDNHDPNECARMALEAWKELKADFANTKVERSVSIH